MSAENDFPGTERPRSAKYLYLPLLGSYVENVEHDSFYTLDKAGQSFWTDDFCERYLLRFNIMEFELDVIRVVNDICSLVPHIL